jgi:hypothetical protein
LAAQDPVSAGLSALMRTDPLSLIGVAPADAHEFVICCGASSSLIDAAGRGLSIVNRDTVPVCQTDVTIPA